MRVGTITSLTTPSDDHARIGAVRLIALSGTHPDRPRHQHLSSASRRSTSHGRGHRSMSRTTSPWPLGATISSPTCVDLKTDFFDKMAAIASGIGSTVADRRRDRLADRDDPAERESRAHPLPLSDTIGLTNVQVGTAARSRGARRERPERREYDQPGESQPVQRREVVRDRRPDHGPGARGRTP